MDSSPAVSIVVPTFEEAPNIAPLVERIFAALAPTNIRAEVLIVDDNSRDGTVEIVEELATRFPVEILVRPKEKGLSSAVLAGFAAARSPMLLVLDADLQHPPELIPQFVGQLWADQADFVIGSRYHPDGSVERSWPWWRLAGSKLATALAKPLTPVSDPLSGFFALARASWQGAADLDPIGYKIALELYVKCRCSRPAELPIQFAARTAGRSKLGGAVVLRYLIHLAKLYRFRYPGLWWTVWIVLVVVIGSMWILVGA